MYWDCQYHSIEIVDRPCWQAIVAGATRTPALSPDPWNTDGHEKRRRRSRPLLGPSRTIPSPSVQLLNRHLPVHCNFASGSLYRDIRYFGRSTMPARIYKPSKTAMQSGQANTKAWVLDFEPEAPRHVEPLMGWTSSGDMRQQLRLRFDSKEEAVAYCERRGVPYQVTASVPPKRRIMFTRTIFPSSAATPGPTDPSLS